jgi:hypothetical protein
MRIQAYYKNSLFINILNPIFNLFFKIYGFGFFFPVLMCFLMRSFGNNVSYT